MARFREVLKNRNFFLLWIGQIISQLGDRLGQMALIAFVYLRAPGSTLQMAKILSFTIIPVFIVGPLAGVYVDRWDRRRTMFACDFLRSLLVLAIPLFLFYSKSLAPVYLIIFTAFSIGRFFVPAKLSIIPDLVDKKDLLIANSLVNTTGMIAATLGFGISGVLVEWLGAKSGFYLNSLTFLISGMFIFLISKKFVVVMDFKKISQEIIEVIRKSVFQEIKEGVFYFIQKKDIRFTAGIIFALWSALGAVYVVIIVFVQNTLHSTTKDLGLLVMFLGIGLFLGSLVYGRFGQRIAHYKVIFISLILSGIMLVIFALGIYNYPNFAMAALLALCLGLTVAPIMIASNTIIHSVSDNDMLGKIFSSFEIVMHLGFLIFMFISSMLAERFSHLLILVIVGGLLSLLGLINLFFNRKAAWLN
ncbi:MAG: MFS transporter [Candidatus Omnitrophica bacterium]|nr:MFS transporter [Candidatus Omnitrophota bacterium]MDD5690794.1 MFS transporter [Candidatus Omnitrophota bacterium]